MNLFARILSHGFALVVVALLALGLIYRGELFPEWEVPDFLALGQKPGATATIQDTETGGAEEPAAAAQEPVPVPTAGDDDAAAASMPLSALLPSEAGEEAVQETAATMPADVVVPDSTADTQMAEPAAAAEAGIEPAGQTEQPAVPPADEAQAVMQEAVEAVTGLMAEPETAAAAAAEAVVAPATEETAVVPAAADTRRGATEAAETTPYRVLAAAREAYWLRDYAAAEQKYQELIALDPDNPDGYGELGNMYFSQGDWDKASVAYYEAGARLAKQGMYDRARQLVEVIRGLNGGQADDLEQQITAAESAAP